MQLVLTTDWLGGKSLPLTCQQQSRLNYKMRVYRAHMRSTWNADLLTGLFPRALHDTYYIRLLLYQVLEMQQLYLIHRNKYSEVAKIRRQRNRSQTNEQNKTPERELNKMKKSNLPHAEAEFKTLVIRKLNDLTENVNKEIGNVKRTSQKCTKMKNILQGINS